MYGYGKYPMGKTRYHFFMEHVREVGDRLKDGIQKAGINFPGWDLAEVMEHYHAVPVWRPLPIHKQAAEFDMYFANWKTPFVLFGLGGNVENPWFYEIAKETDSYQKVILMNPATAAKKGLKEGDMIEVDFSIRIADWTAQAVQTLPPRSDRHARQLRAGGPSR